MYIQKRQQKYQPEGKRAIFLSPSTPLRAPLYTYFYRTNNVSTTSSIHNKYDRLYMLLSIKNIHIILACFASLRSTMIVELTGLELLTNAFGVLLMFQGVAAAVGSPLLGKYIKSYC